MVTARNHKSPDIYQTLGQKPMVSAWEKEAAERLARAVIRQAAKDITKPIRHEGTTGRKRNIRCRKIRDCAERFAKSNDLDYWCALADVDTDAVRDVLCGLDRWTEQSTISIVTTSASAKTCSK